MYSATRYALLALAALSTIAADYATILQDLKNTDNTTNQLTSQTNTYTATGAQTFSLANLSRTLKNQIDQAIKDANGSPSPTSAQAQTVLTYINGTLVADVKKTQTATKNKRTVIRDAGITSTFVQDIKDIASRVDKLAVALINKAPTSALKSAGDSIRKDLAASFQQEITYLSP